MVALGLHGRSTERGALEVGHERCLVNAATSLGDRLPVGGGIMSVAARVSALLDESSIGGHLRDDGILFGSGESRHGAKGNREEREHHFRIHFWRSFVPPC